MRNLLDTHALIWFLNGDEQLSNKARKAIEKTGAVNFVSIASLWEMAIKTSLGKLEMKSHFSKVAELMSENGFQLLPITFADTLLLLSLPFHHKDPFDRIIIAQSISNELTIISKDNYFNEYKIKLVW